MASAKVQCIRCEQYRPGSSSPYALGLCRAEQSRDGHEGQWPYSEHQCPYFRPISPPAPASGAGLATRPDRDVRFYVAELRGEECQCGASKKSGHSFCYGCYRRLPEEMRGPLYRVMGNGYEEAYERAYVWLAKHSEG